MGRRDSDSDPEDSYVEIGTPLSTYQEDEAIKKPVSLQDQKVKDSKGRQRFHGAFTGGFSAGYFNTVGSVEGWTPSTFVSTREQKQESSFRQNPEDFMDDEDFSEYGIAPKQVQTTDDFVTKRSLKRPLVADVIIPGGAPLADLVVPASLPIGISLLRKLGWKEGQGVGPRVRKHTSRTKDKQNKKVYGCTMMPEANQQKSEEEDIDEDLSDLEDELSLKDITFAPKDICPISFTPKDNLHGLGYSGITAPSGSGHVELFVDFGSSKGGRGQRGIKGQAFGVGAFEEEDEDIYSRKQISDYDKVLGGPEKDDTHGWTVPKNTGSHRERLSAPDLTDVLEGFKRLTTQLQPKKVYPAPAVPRDFRPVHRYTEEEDTSCRVAAEIPRKFSMTWKNLDSATRKEALGEKPSFKSVFDLLSEKDREQITRAKTKQQSLSMPTIVKNTEESPRTEPVSSPQSEDPTAPSRATVPLFKGSLKFKPFAKDPEKQARYEKYMECTSHKRKFSYGELASGRMTESQRAKEQHEFARAAQLYRPMSKLMATRFTGAKFNDDEREEVEVEKGGDENEQNKAAQMKMFGKLTRDTFEWHPARTLVRRFNVPNPYPESHVVGLLKVKTDKASIYNCLHIPSADDSTEHSRSRKSSRHDKHDKGSETLAIEASSGRDSQPSSSRDRHETKTEELDSERPSFDLFKAIFDDSDDEVDEQNQETPSENQHSSIMDHLLPKDAFSHLSEKKHEPPEIPTEPRTSPSNNTNDTQSPDAKDRSPQRPEDDTPKRERTRKSRSSRWGSPVREDATPSLNNPDHDSSVTMATSGTPDPSVESQTGCHASDQNMEEKRVLFVPKHARHQSVELVKVPSVDVATAKNPGVTMTTSGTPDPSVESQTGCHASDQNTEEKRILFVPKHARHQSVEPAMKVLSVDVVTDDNPGVTMATSGTPDPSVESQTGCHASDENMEEKRLLFVPKHAQHQSVELGVEVPSVDVVTAESEDDMESYGPMLPPGGSTAATLVDLGPRPDPNPSPSNKTSKKKKKTKHKEHKKHKKQAKSKKLKKEKHKSSMKKKKKKQKEIVISSTSSSSSSDSEGAEDLLNRIRTFTRPSAADFMDLT